MADNKNPQQSVEDNAADYSGYFKKDEPIKPTAEKPVSPLEELPARKAFSKKLKYLIAVLIILAVAQGAYIYYITKSKNPPLPDGFELIIRENGPPIIRPTK